MAISDATLARAPAVAVVPARRVPSRVRVCRTLTVSACVVLLLQRETTFDLATQDLGLLRAILGWLAARIGSASSGANDALPAALLQRARSADVASLGLRHRRRVSMFS